MSPTSPRHGRNYFSTSKKQPQLGDENALNTKTAQHEMDEAGDDDVEETGRLLRQEVQRMSSSTVLLRGESSPTGQEDDETEMMTPLDLTMEKIGMGKYQWTLLMLCGCGWMADNVSPLFH